MKFHSFTLGSFFAAALFIVGISPGKASITLSDNPILLTISDDITFTLNTDAGNEDVVAVMVGYGDDRPLENISLNFSKIPVSVSINSTLNVFEWQADFYYSTQTPEGDVAANDGYIWFPQPFTLAQGETFTIVAGIYSTDMMGVEFPPEAFKTFSGEMFLATKSDMVRVSNIVTVPEPSAIALCAMALGGLALLRRAVRQGSRD